MRIRELILPLACVAMLGSMLLPLPPILMDFLLVGNLIVALTLLVSALYISDPLKLSSLPTILLLATLFRLALNISTSRLILASGEAGQLIEAFGTVVVHGNLAVGAVIFMMITLVQFIVIAKGSERVAEVAARFTLDALPGKQMSIDADVRAGLIDFESARRKREDLQTESRFYGALDGAMKFVKGDAIAGIIIALVNILGGFTVGILMEGLDLQAALSKYTVLTVGDGLVAQIPALLNSLAAGIVVTRVTRGEGSSLAGDVISQLGQTKRVKLLIGGVAVLMAFIPGMPALPFLGIAAVFVIAAGMRSDAEASGKQAEKQLFQPRVPGVLVVELGAEQGQSLYAGGSFPETMEAFRKDVYDVLGLILCPPEFVLNRTLTQGFRILMRGVHVKTCTSDKRGNELLQEIVRNVRSLVDTRAEEFIDDILTRRTLDYFDKEAPELVSAVVPGVVTVTQLSMVLKGLAEEGITIRNFDLILQAIAEIGPKVSGERLLLEEVRVALRRVIVQQFFGEPKAARVIFLDPLLDLGFFRAEREGKPLDPALVRGLAQRLLHFDRTGKVLVASKGARRLVRDCLVMREVSLPVVAHEELGADVELASSETLSLPDETSLDDMIDQLAA